jgi:hypothetical protein
VLVLPLFTLAALVAPPSVGQAGGEAQVVCTGPLPFSQAEMEEALRARRPLLGAGARIEVRADEAGRALVRVGRVEREVDDWGGRSGEEAARLVAVLAEDLAQSDLPVVVSPPAASASATGREIRLGLTVQSPFDQAGAAAHVMPALEAAVDLTRGFAAFLTGGYRRVTAGGGFSALEMDEVSVRAGAAYQRRWFELRAGGLVRPYSVGGAGSYTGSTWGGTLSGVARWRVGRHLQLVLAAGLDALASRTVFSVNQRPILSTAWLAPWLGAGLAWGFTL